MALRWPATSKRPGAWREPRRDEPSLIAALKPPPPPPPPPSPGCGMTLRQAPLPEATVLRPLSHRQSSRASKAVRVSQRVPVCVWLTAMTHASVRRPSRRRSVARPPRRRAAAISIVSSSRRRQRRGPLSVPGTGLLACERCVARRSADAMVPRCVPGHTERSRRGLARFCTSPGRRARAQSAVLRLRR